MVDQQLGQLEWEDHPALQSGNGDRDRCFEDGLGSVLQRRVYGRLLVAGGENSSYQCTGVDCSNNWSASLLQRQKGNFSAVEDRQCYSGGIRQQDGRNKVFLVGSTGKRAVAMVSAT